MKKVCFVTTTHLTLQSFVIETAKKMHETGDYDITFVCAEEENFRKSLPKFIHFKSVQMKRGIDLSGIANVFSLYKIFKKDNFDLVQYSTPNASLYASIAATLAHIPVRLYCQWGIRYVGMSGLSKFIFKTLEKIVCKLSTHIRGVSRKNVEFSLNEKLYKQDKVTLLGEGGTIGVDLDHYDCENRQLYRSEYRNLLGFSDSDFVLGFVGRASKDKGSNELLKVMQELSNFDSKFKLLCIGTLEPQNGLDNDLLYWASNSKCIKLLGAVDNSELNYYYSVMDCYVHPSYREGFGLVLQEAGAMKTPIITTNIAGAGEVMVDGESCLLCEPRNSKSLRETILKISADKQLQKNLGEKARERCNKYYDRNVMIASQLENYKNLLK